MYWIHLRSLFTCLLDSNFTQMECLYNFAPGRLNEPVGASRSSLSAVTCWWSQWKGQHRDNWNIISTIFLGFPYPDQITFLQQEVLPQTRVFQKTLSSRSFSHSCQVDFANEGHHPVREEAGSLFRLSWMLVVIWDRTTATMHHARRHLKNTVRVDLGCKTWKSWSMKIHVGSANHVGSPCDEFLYTSMRWSWCSRICHLHQEQAFQTLQTSNQMEIMHSNGQNLSSVVICLIPNCRIPPRRASAKKCWAAPNDPRLTVAEWSSTPTGLKRRKINWLAAWLVWFTSKSANQMQNKDVDLPWFAVRAVSFPKGCCNGVACHLGGKIAEAHQKRSTGEHFETSCLLPFSSSSLPIKVTGKTWYWWSKRPCTKETLMRHLQYVHKKLCHRTACAGQATTSLEAELDDRWTCA